jgi:hypothetical protein
MRQERSLSYVASASSKVTSGLIEKDNALRVDETKSFESQWDEAVCGSKRLRPWSSLIQYDIDRPNVSELMFRKN